MVSEILKAKLSKFHRVDLIQTGRRFDYQTILAYDYLVFGFPTYHCEPSPAIMDFIRKIPEQKEFKAAFAYTTYGLYTGNSMRIFIRKLLDKKIYINDFFQIKGPASDGVLLFPSIISFMFKYENNVKKKIDKYADKISKLADSPSNQLHIPRYKWYVPLNEIIKFFGKKVYDRYRNNLRILKERCINCKLCVKNCEWECFSEGKEYSLLNTENCKFCLKCVHNCPAKAIIFSDRMKNKPRLNRTFYKKMKCQILSQQ